MAQIFIFGASSTYGAWDEKSGWADRLKQYFHQRVINSNDKDYFLVYNLGISGEDTRGLLRRINNDIKIRGDKDEENIILIWMITNDTVYNNKKKTH